MECQPHVTCYVNRNFENFFTTSSVWRCEEITEGGTGKVESIVTVDKVSEYRETLKK